MNSKEREEIAELRTHVVYIREKIKQVDKKLDKLPCSPHGEEIVALREALVNHLQTHKRDLILLGTFISVLSFILNYFIG